jgi:transcriptional regulator GlxA family with amidase domain
MPVEDDYGTDLARRVARWLVMFLQRAGGQAQFSVSSVPALHPTCLSGPFRDRHQMVKPSDTR